MNSLGNVLLDGYRLLEPYSVVNLRNPIGGVDDLDIIFLEVEELGRSPV